MNGENEYNDSLRSDSFPSINSEYEGEIVLYQPDVAVKIEVRIDNETVWLNRKQMSLLFGRDIKTIGKHINNALKEELAGCSVVANFATTASDGKVYQTEHYNLDMIVSVGFRVKSKRGIDFRIWATKVLKEYLLKGYAINLRLETMEQRIDGKIHQLEEKIGNLKDKVNFFVRTSIPPVEGVFCNGKIFDAYKFAADLIRYAQFSIVLVDNYVDDTVLMMLSKCKVDVKVHIYTANLSKQFLLDIDRYNRQYAPIEVTKTNKFHDRFLIIDQRDVYHIGASLKDLGKKLFAFSKLDIPTDTILGLLNE